MASEIATLDDLADFTLVARSPGEMITAQQSLIAWAERKFAAEQELANEAQEQLDIATKNKWQTRGWRSRVNLSVAKIRFYQKIKLALEAGYYIVPPFDIDVFAIRTKRSSPSGSSTWRHDRHLQTPQLLAAGEGRYVSDMPTVLVDEQTITKPDGKKEIEVQSWAEDFREVDFPFKLAKPAILSATAEALALRIFDTIGVMPGRRARDPIICGQILPPHKRFGDPVTFFVAWWLDTKTL